MPQRISSWFGTDPPPLSRVPTQWSQVLAAKAPGTGGAAALRTLAHRYYGPVFRTLLCMGLVQDDAREMTQRFMIPFCEGKYVQRADPAAGSFRAFLKRCLANFVSDEREKEVRRRGTPMDDDLDPAAPEVALDDRLDRETAWDVFDRARESTRVRLASDLLAWEALCRSDLAPAEGADRAQTALARGLGVPVGRYRRALYHAREVFRAEVCRLLAEGAEARGVLDAEVRWFLQTIERGRL